MTERNYEQWDMVDEYGNYHKVSFRCEECGESCGTYIENGIRYCNSCGCEVE